MSLEVTPQEVLFLREMSAGCKEFLLEDQALKVDQKVWWIFYNAGSWWAWFSFKSVQLEPQSCLELQGSYILGEGGFLCLSVTTVLDEVPPLSSVAEPKKRKILDSCKDIDTVEWEVNDQENLLCGDNGSMKECPKNIGKQAFLCVCVLYHNGDEIWSADYKAQVFAFLQEQTGEGCLIGLDHLMFLLHSWLVSIF